MFSFIVKMTRPFLKYVMLMMVSILGIAICINISSYLMKVIADTAMSTDAKDIPTALFPIVIEYVALGFGIVLMYRIIDYCSMQFAPRQKEYIATYITERMLRHSVAFFKKNLVGNLANKINDTVLIPEIIRSFVTRIVLCFFMIIFMCCTMAKVSYLFVIGLLSWILLFIGVSTIFLFKNSHIARETSEAQANTLGQIVDALSHTLIISLFARHKHEKKRLREATQSVVKKERRQEKFLLMLYTFQGMSYVVYEIICAVWLLNGISDGSLTAGDFILVFSVNWQAIEQFWDISNEARKVWQQLGNVFQALRAINLPIDISDPPNAKELNVSKGEIIFDRVSFFYHGATPLFENKSIVINARQKIGLVGYSGSGKSTFINLILRLYDVTSGKILIDGQDIKDIKQSSLHNAISVIPQDCSLFNRSLMENIRYGRLDATDDEVREVARKVFIHDVIERLPQKYDTIAGDKGGRLSGGQRQLISVARAMIKNAPILILDEATSHLDLITEKKLQQSFFELMRNKTAIVIAHRLSTLLFMDRILVFDRGNIVQDGTHMSLLAENGLYKNLWHAQTKGFLPKVRRK